MVERVSSPGGDRCTRQDRDRSTATGPKGAQRWVLSIRRSYAEGGNHVTE